MQFENCFKNKTKFTRTREQILSKCWNNLVDRFWTKTNFFLLFVSYFFAMFFIISVRSILALRSYKPRNTIATKSTFGKQTLCRWIYQSIFKYMSTILHFFYFWKFKCFTDYWVWVNISKQLCLFVCLFVFLAKKVEL